jgi:RHS repeat-associated protein
LAGANVYRFSSKELHVNSGLYYYGYRWYHPNLQRWPNRDPIGEAGSINLYGYVANRPINQVDPLGLAYGNPVSGPYGPVGPSSPYDPGWPYYPNGYCYKPKIVICKKYHWEEAGFDSAKACIEDFMNDLALLDIIVGIPGVCVPGGDKAIACGLAAQLFIADQLCRSCVEYEEL